MARHHDDLDDILAQSAELLAEGQSDPASPWRNPTLVTQGLDGTPQARTVVLRRFDLTSRQIETHTDSRSAKYGELRAHSAASLHGWDGTRRVQLRLTGPVRLHVADTLAEAAWASLRPQTRETYAVAPGPGTQLDAPDEVRRVDEAAARAVFCVVRLTFERLEYLHLGRDGHRRARFCWTRGQCDGTWLVP